MLRSLLFEALDLQRIIRERVSQNGTGTTYCGIVRAHEPRERCPYLLLAVEQLVVRRLHRFYARLDCSVGARFT